VLVRPGQADHPLADDVHGPEALEQRQQPCYTGETGLVHTGAGPASAAGGSEGAAGAGVLGGAGGAAGRGSGADTLTVTGFDGSLRGAPVAPSGWVRVC
jgi:hypothetical protein